MGAGSRAARRKHVAFCVPRKTGANLNRRDWASVSPTGSKLEGGGAGRARECGLEQARGLPEAAVRVSVCRL